MTAWCEDKLGAASIGLRDGVFCIGCCWLLMAVMFAVGVMNLLWTAVLSAVVLAEKVLPRPRLIVGLNGNPWRVILCLGERATPEQREALSALFLGRAGHRA